MKVTNLRRKLAAALVSAGLLAPGALQAADLNVNLLQNPGFENLDATDNFILGWEDGTGLGYTYDSGVYDNGGPLAGGGSFYFTPNAGDIGEPGVVSQLVDLSTGDSASVIANGTGAFQLGGFFSSYQNDGDFGVIHVDFRDGQGTSLGSGMVQDQDTSTWTQHSTGGVIPVGTQSAVVSLYGVALSGGPDGYMDNVDFRVTEEVILPALELRVDREDGSLVLQNRTGATVNLSGYQITSDFGGLAPDNWLSIAENYDADSGSGDVDDTNIWTELTEGDAHGDLSEGDLATGTGGALAHTQEVALGNAGTWIQNPNEDLVFQYISDGEVQTGIVQFEGASPFAVGDVNTDGVIDAADWAIVRSNQHASLAGLSPAEAYRAGDLTADGQNNHADFAAFKDAFDSANGAGSFVAMLANQQAVPEPGSLVLVLASGLMIGTIFRRRNS